MFHRMFQIASRVALVTAVILMTRSGLFGADTPSKRQEGSKSSMGKSSGVITKVEPCKEGEGKSKHAWKLTLNTDVVWRDFVRDQAKMPRKGSETKVAREAEKGKESVAAVGHPNAKSLLVSVALDQETDISLRYRSATDAVSEGAATPEAAARAETARDAANDRDALKKEHASKARKLQPGELKPGLWVEVEFEREGPQHEACRVMVMRPVGGPDTSPAEAKPPAVSSAKSSK
jgi:hypothetical protein